LNKDIEKRIIKAIVGLWSVAMELNLNIQEENIRRLEAFEMRVWRRMVKISWRDMKTNEEVL